MKVSFWIAGGVLGLSLLAMVLIPVLGEAGVQFPGFEGEGSEWAGVLAFGVPSAALLGLLALLALTVVTALRSLRRR